MFVHSEAFLGKTVSFIHHPDSINHYDYYLWVALLLLFLALTRRCILNSKSWRTERLQLCAAG